jgi:hypothetical protein
MPKEKMCEEACRIISKEVEQYEADTTQLEHERKALVSKLLKMQTPEEFDGVQQVITTLMGDINDNKKFEHLLKTIYKQNCVPQSKWGKDGVESCNLEDILTSILPTRKRTRKPKT